MDKITHKVRCEQWTNIIKESSSSALISRAIFTAILSECLIS